MPPTSQARLPEHKKRDGYVSLEVSPYLAHDTNGTLDEARRLWKTVARENVMIKVPGTAEGIPAFRQLISEGINVNVRCCSRRRVYEEVAAAYIDGVEKFAATAETSAKSPAWPASSSAASIRWSTHSSASNSKGNRRRRKAKLQGILGKVAIANAKLTYEAYQRIFSTPRWKALAAKNAQTQRVLWASTGTKNPNYSDVLYIDELIGPDTVNTVPPATLDAFPRSWQTKPDPHRSRRRRTQNHGRPRGVGIVMKEATDKLTTDGVKLFADAFDTLLAAVEKNTKRSATPQVNAQTASLPADLDGAVKKNLNDWRATGKVRRLWQLDAILWTNDDETKWLGWLGVADDRLPTPRSSRRSPPKSKPEASPTSSCSAWAVPAFAPKCSH